MLKLFKKKSFLLYFVVLFSTLLPNLFKILFNLEHNDQLTNLLSVIPIQFLLLSGLLLIHRKSGNNYFNFTQIKLKKIYWLLPEILLLILVFFMIEFPEKNFSISIIIKLAILSVMVGIFEELLSRGFVLHYFCDKGNIFFGIIASALFFGFLHLSNYNGSNLNETYFQVIETIGAGFYAAILTLTFRSIIPLIITHSIYDFFLFIKLYFDKINLSSATSQTSNLLDLSNYVLPLIYIFVGLVIYLFEKKNIEMYYLKKTCSKKPIYSPIITLLFLLIYILLFNFIKYIL